MARSADYMAGFLDAKNLAETVATNEAASADKELKAKLSSGQEERTQVRKAYAEKIAREIRKIKPAP